MHWCKESNTQKRLFLQQNTQTHAKANLKCGTYWLKLCVTFKLKNDICNNMKHILLQQNELFIWRVSLLFITSIKSILPVSCCSLLPLFGYWDAHNINDSSHSLCMLDTGCPWCAEVIANRKPFTHQPTPHYTNAPPLMTTLCLEFPYPCVLRLPGSHAPLEDSHSHNMI